MLESTDRLVTFTALRDAFDYDRTDGAAPTNRPSTAPSSPIGWSGAWSGVAVASRSTRIQRAWPRVHLDHLLARTPENVPPDAPHAMPLKEKQR